MHVQLIAAFSIIKELMREKKTTLNRAARLVAQSDKRRAVQGAIDAFKRNDVRALDNWFEVLNMAEKKLSCAQN